jgi:sugar phosphate isomerase/epimerase
VNLSDTVALQIGWCTSDLSRAKEAGFDYVECGVRNIVKLSDGEFARLQEERRRLGLTTPVGNVFLPPDLKIVGATVDRAAEMAYVHKAMHRCRQLGVEVLVFGSAKSRVVPEGFPRETAFDQLCDFSRRVSAVAADHDILVVLEPVGRPECNIIVDSREAARLVAAVARPNFQLMIDLYHWHNEREPPSSLLEVGPHIKHLHVANPLRRRFPQEGDGYDYRPFFRLLREGGYRGRVSIEAKAPEDFAFEGPRSIAFLRRDLTEAARASEHRREH